MAMALPTSNNRKSCLIEYVAIHNLDLFQRIDDYGIFCDHNTYVIKVKYSSVTITSILFNIEYY